MFFISMQYYFTVLSENTFVYHSSVRKHLCMQASQGSIQTAEYLKLQKDYHHVKVDELGVMCKKSHKLFWEKKRNLSVWNTNTLALSTNKFIHKRQFRMYNCSRWKGLHRWTFLNIIYNTACAYRQQN